jgi:predicted DNA-binding helix-hairpin-helix protein
MNANVLEKLKILAESAKYDVSCASSGTVRANKPGTLGNTVGGWGICHSFAEDGRCISLLKVMLTNYCIYDCAYCINRRSNDLPRATLSVSDRENKNEKLYIPGLFLSNTSDNGIISRNKAQVTHLWSVPSCTPDIP